MTMASRAASFASSVAVNRDHSISVIRCVSRDGSAVSALSVEHAGLQGWQRSHRGVEPFAVQFVELSVHGVEEDEAIQPLQERELSHPHAHMSGTSADYKLQVELFVGSTLHHVGDDQAVGRKQICL